MNEPRQDDLQGLSPLGFHKIAYVEWGDKENPDVLVCVHGFSRNSRDFDYLARALQHKYRIICPDMVGRGNSDYKGNPAIYNSLQYVSDLVALLARIDVKEVNWLGTSMGGILGMTLASQANTPIKKLILNDVGMFVPKQGLQRILSYAKIYPSFKNLQLAEESLRQRLVPFGIQTPEEWQHLVKYGFKQGADGQYHYAFDSAIVDAFEAAASADGHLEPLWKAIKCPVLVLRGENSDILLPKTVKHMIKIKPDTQAATIPNCGHAPSLMDQNQIDIIGSWLMK